MNGPAPDRAFVVPAELPGPSGGSVYNERVLSVWRGQGLDVAEEAVGGTWPRPGAGSQKALARRLRRYRSVLIDGIIASAAPDAIAEAQAGGVEVAVLVHLPLPAETGLSLQRRCCAEAQERRSLQMADHVICTSHWAGRDVTARYGPLPYEVAPPGCDAAPLAQGSSPPGIFFLGSISPRKNPLLLIRALEPLQDLEWTLRLTGPQGPDREYADAVSTAARRLHGRVEMTGPLSGEDLDLAWDAADLLSLPSLAETYGMVVTEAAARGIPAMVGEGTGAEEALAAAGHQPGAAPLPGCAADPTDAGAWTEALSRWLRQEDLRSLWRTHAVLGRDRLPPWSETAKSLQAALRW
ncbi:glycosyltransferase family 4 protein [Nesterenkonia populi]